MAFDTDLRSSETKQYDYSRVYDGMFAGMGEGADLEGDLIAAEDLQWIEGDWWENVAFTDEFMGGSRSESQELNYQDASTFMASPNLDISYGGVQSPWKKGVGSTLEVSGFGLAGDQGGGESSVSPSLAGPQQVSRREDTKTVEEGGIGTAGPTSATAQTGGGKSNIIFWIIGGVVCLVVGLGVWSWWKKKKKKKKKNGKSLRG